eukprot:Pgem_evm1s9010
MDVEELKKVLPYYIPTSKELLQQVLNLYYNIPTEVREEDQRKAAFDYFDKFLITQHTPVHGDVFGLGYE